MIRHNAIIAAMTLLISGLDIQTQAWAETDARSLLEQCLPEQSSASYRSHVNIDITHKNAPAETHRYTRLKEAQHLLLTPESQGGYGYFRKDSQDWLYNNDNNSLEQIDKNKIPAGLLSETLLPSLAGLDNFELKISSHNAFGGQDYYTVTASKSDSLFPKRSLSFKQADQQCNLIRAAYFSQGNKLSKKLFFQWQMLDNDKLLKTLHIEDVHTLEAVRYHIEDLESVTGFTATDWPVISTQ